MKKNVFTILAFAICLNAFSEETTEVFKPVRGVYTTQVGLNIGTGTNLRSFGLNGRYFINSKMACRATYSLTANNTFKKVNQFPDGTGVEGTYSQKTNTNFLFLGVEKHFKGSKRFSPFVGLELGVGKSSNKEKGENSNGWQFVGSYSRESVNQQNLMRATTFLGFDYYITNAIYLGVEYQFLRYDFTQTSKNEQTVTQNNITTTTRGSNDTVSAFSSNNATTSIRLGWKIN